MENLRCIKYTSYMKMKWLIVIVLVVSIASHFAYFGHPNEVVFDEVHFGKFISGYLTHEYFFDIHPPLGKLLISGMGWLTEFKPGFSFANIGEKFPDNGYVWLRLLPTIAGTLLPPILALLALELGLSRWTAFSLGILIALENGMIVQSRLILLDSFLLLFGFLGLYFYILYRNKKRRAIFLVLTGLFCGLSFSVKWTGLSFLGIILLLQLVDSLKKISLKSLKISLLSLILLPLAIYISVFVIHLNLLSKSGPGDAFMSQEFKKSLIGSSDYQNQSLKPLNIFQKIVELNIKMYQTNAGLTAGHPYGSKWYTWPIMQRPIFYWSGMDEKIYLLGNLPLWWGSSLATAIFICLFFIKRWWRNSTAFLLLLGYVSAYIPFVPVPRVLFLYHYFAPLIFSIMILIFLINELPRRYRIIILFLYIITVFVNFLYFSPLTYGTKISDSQYQQRVWLGTWR